MGIFENDQQTKYAPKCVLFISKETNSLSAIYFALCKKNTSGG